MRQEPVRAYGHLHPAGNPVPEAVASTLDSWSLEAELVLAGDLFRLSFEGVCFPAEEIVEALRPFLEPHSQGRLDVLDLEAWTLTRYTFTGTVVRCNQRSLNHVLDYSGH